MASAHPYLGDLDYDSDEDETPRSGHMRDYEKISTIGRGGFGLVWHVKEKSTGRHLAIKECGKMFIKRQQCEQSVMRERMAMVKMNHHFIIKLVKAFQDHYALFFVMELMNGTLGDEFVKHGTFRNELTRFYTAEIIMALEYLRRVRVVHKDLKMMNVLLDRRKHIKLADFGCSVFVEKQDPNASRRQQWRQNRPNMNVRQGTRNYWAPEVIAEGPVSFGTDLWSLGCILYEMHTGQQAFGTRESGPIDTCEHTPWPDNCDPSLRDLVSIQLLVADAEERLGCRNMKLLKMHPFYGTRDPASWEQLHTVDPPPFDPKDPRARTHSRDRPSYEFFFSPATDRVPYQEHYSQAPWEGFDSADTSFQVQMAGALVRDDDSGSPPMYPV